MSRRKNIKMRPGWGFTMKTPDGQEATATFIGWEGRKTIFAVEFPEGMKVDPFKGEPPEGPLGRPHRSERNWNKGRQGYV